MDYGTLLNDAAKKQGLSVEEVAFRAKASRNTAVNVFAGSKTINLRSVARIANVLGFEVAGVDLKPMKQKK